MAKKDLDALLKMREQLEVRIKHLKAKSKVQLRKDETRKKILVGSYFLEKHEKEGTIEELIAQIDSFLIRNNDRELFDLELKEEAIST